MRNEQNKNIWQHSWRFAVSELCAVISSKGWTTEFSDSIHLSLIDLTTACVCDGSNRVRLSLSVCLSLNATFYIPLGYRTVYACVCMCVLVQVIFLILTTLYYLFLFGLVEVKLSSTIHQVHQMKSYWVRRDYRIRFALRFTTRIKFSSHFHTHVYSLLLALLWSCTVYG